MIRIRLRKREDRMFLLFLIIQISLLFLVILLPQVLKLKPDLIIANNVNRLLICLQDSQSQSPIVNLLSTSQCAKDHLSRVSICLPKLFPQNLETCQYFPSQSPSHLQNRKTSINNFHSLSR